MTEDAITRRLHITIYADDEPSRKAEKLYQICGESGKNEVAEWLKEYFPSARPTGEWEHLSIKSISRSGVDGLQALQCSNCGKWVTTPYMYYPSYHKFCPCCGAKMINSNNGLDMRGGDTE